MKKLLTSYTVSGNTITLSGVNRPLESILLITDAKTNTVLYSAQAGGATDYTQGSPDSSITLSVAPSSSTGLQIFYDDNSDITPTSGTLSVSNNTYAVTTTNYSTLTFQAVKSGTITGGSVSIYGSVDGTTFSVLTTYVSLTTGGSSTSFAATNAITIGQINTIGLKAIQFSGGSTIVGGGSIAIQVNQSVATSNVMLDNSLPTGSNVIGQVTANAGTNLNTSSLALESGGNLATIATNTGKIPSKGTATIANSTPVNIASDQTVPVSIADGSDSAEGSKADSAATNSTSSWSVVALLKGLYAALTGTPSVGAVSATNTVSTTGIVPSAGNLLINSTDVSAYRSVTLQVTPVSTAGGTFQAQVSSDGTNWVYISGQSSAPNSGGTTTSSYLSGSGGNYLIATTSFNTFQLTGARYFRVYILSGSNTGTVNTTAFFSSLPVQPTLVQDSSNNLLVAGTVTANIPANTVTSTYSLTGAQTAGTAILVPSTNISAYRSVAIQCTSAGVNGTWQAQISLDGSTWATTTLLSFGGGGVTSTFSATGAWQLNLNAPYFRIALVSNNQTSGTTTVYLSFSQQPITHVWQSSQYNSAPTPQTSVGFGSYHTNNSAASVNATLVKSSAGTIGSLILTNSSANWAYFKLVNKASAPTVGTDTAVINIGVAPNTTLDCSSSFAGLRMTTGIAYYVSAGSSLTDNNPLPMAGTFLVNLTYV